MTSALKLSGVVKRFGNHVAVNDISFEVPRGVVYGILGPNGAGKSTTLRMINDIIAPDAGTITVLDTLTPGSAAAQKIGYLPEERGLYPKMKVGEIVEFMGELRGLSRAEARKRGGEWLERLGLSKWLGNKVQDLSKGMQQKVQFVTALLHEPDIVILDEPWSGLDPVNADVLRDTVSQIRAAGRTVLFSTHQMEQAEKIVDSLCIIARGELLLEGKLREIKAHWSADNWIALAFDGAEAKAKAKPVIENLALVGGERPTSLTDRVDIEVKPAADVTPQQILSALVTAGVALRTFEVVVPSLHDIFVAKVGPDAAIAERVEEGAA
ncbi:MAG TPA: ATP-binding cassette domain-containing protein [Kofleriaceae bacterium]|jgi:ABC-2 type transport system ATP-binding protein